MPKVKVGKEMVKFLANSDHFIMATGARPSPAAATSVCQLGSKHTSYPPRKFPSATRWLRYCSSHIG
jgi:hypothetical protein